MRARWNRLLNFFAQDSRDLEARDFNPQVNAPRFLFLQINKRCNLRCEHCTFWQDNDNDRQNYLSVLDRRRVIAEFQTLNPRGALVICGGESMLDLEDYFDVSRTCRELGITCISVVNGTRIRTPSMAERMLNEGPHEVSISLNSHRADLHDRTRGVNGAFDKAIKAIRLLVDARERMRISSKKIYVMGLIFDENYRELPEFYDFVLNDLRADKLKLNFIQPTFGYAEVDKFFADHSNIDADELLVLLRACDARFHLKLNPAWMSNVQMYFRSLQRATDLERGWSSTSATAQHICNTYERNIMVDHYGTARLCFSTDFRGMQLTEEGDLRRFWVAAKDIREQMRSCNRFCGISHSVRRVSSTLSPAAYSSAPG